MSKPTRQGTRSKSASRRPSLVRKARDLIDGARTDLAGAETGGLVHGARRRIKRLRSLIRLMRPVVGEAAHSEARRHLKVAADALSHLRRSEALAATVERLDAELPAGHGLGLLVSAHHAAHTDAVPPADSLAAAREAIAAAAGTMRPWQLPGGKVNLISDAFAETYRRARKKLHRALKSGDADALHDARKHVIHHMHHLELLSEALPQDPASRIEALNALRNILGDFNDLVELESLSESNPGTSHRKVRKVLRARRKTLLAKARKSWRPLFGKKTKAFVRSIGAMWPQTET